MLTVHHLDDSRSQRILWLLEELQLPYELQTYKRGSDRLAPPELKAVHPLGKAPILTESGLTLAETGAIVEYILESHARGRLMPEKDSPDYWRCRHFLHYAEGSAMPPLFLSLVLSVIAERAPALVRPVIRTAMDKANEAFVQPQTQLHLDYWEASLTATGWFAGPAFSAADVMMSFPVEAASARLDFSGRPLLRDFLARIHARPAYRAALERGGPYAYAS
jgi:glutathione S-transferase